MTAHTVLIVAHEYPPINSAGTERVLKFAQYLPDFGYQPIVLTTGRYGGLPTDTINHVFRADDLVHAAFGLVRRRRAGDVPQTEQFRVATVASQSALGRLRDAVMIPDTKLGWLLPAVRLGQRLIAKHHPILIFSSSPPETAHLIAGRLSRASGVPWVADLRDGWLFEPPNPTLRQPRLRRTLEGRLERGMMRQATAVVTATAPIADDLRARYATMTPRLVTINNGYDRADCAGLARQHRAGDNFLLVYTGSLSASSQGRSADALWAAIALLFQNDTAPQLRVQVVGAVTASERSAVQDYGLGEVVSFVAHVPRRAVYQYQLDADALILITAPGSKSTATSKLYDYIGAGRPILALAHGNTAADIVERYELGITAPPDNPPAIAQAIIKLLCRQREGATWPGFSEAQARFERRALTGLLADVFDETLGCVEP